MFSAKMSHLNAYYGIRSVPEARYFDIYMYVDVHKQPDAWWVPQTSLYRAQNFLIWQSCDTRNTCSTCSYCQRYKPLPSSCHAPLVKSLHACEPCSAIDLTCMMEQIVGHVDSLLLRLFWFIFQVKDWAAITVIILNTLDTVATVLSLWSPSPAFAALS